MPETKFEAPVEPVEPTEPVKLPEPVEPTEPTPEQPGEDEEAEQEDAESQPEPTPEPEGMSEADIEKLRKSLDRETKRHTERVSELLGDAATEVVLCPLCGDPAQGFLWPLEAVQPRDELHGRLLDVIKNPAGPDYVESQTVSQCDACRGLGKVRTGSRVPSNETNICPHCRGYGFYPPPGAAQNGRADAEGEPVPVLAGVPEPVLEDTDAWGSPRKMPDGQDNPNYGRMPQYKDPNLP